MDARAAQAVRRSEVMLADIPEDLDDRTFEKASGVVRLPFHLDWSTPEGVYDVDSPNPTKPDSTELTIRAHARSIQLPRHRDSTDS